MARPKADAAEEGGGLVKRPDGDLGHDTPARNRMVVQEDDGFAMPAAKRIRTAPAETAKRPKIGPRAGTLLAGRRRGDAGARRYNDGQESFRYKFDSVSDTESSSSSEDEAPVPIAKRPTTEVVAPSTSDSGKSTSKGNHERRRFLIGNDFFRTKGRVSRRDGRLKISINETANSGYVAKALGQSIRNHLDIPRRDKDEVAGASKKTRHHRKGRAEAVAHALCEEAPIPCLNIVIMVIGSRGDIQPFLKIGKILKEKHGHRVRIATHPVFKDFVEKLELEHFDIGGDPSELMAFMVKNPGLIPNMKTLREGEIGRRRASMAEMFEGFWKACIEDSDKDSPADSGAPFVADAIIANPPSMAHVHIAERLGIPLHIIFTFPYTPTTQFPHPLANIKAKRSNVDAGYVNFMSYPLVEMMTWQGLGDIVNRFRENTLRLEPVSSLWAPGALYRMKVPYTYMWSPMLVPKPPDWGPEIDISGFVFLDLAQNFQPPEELTRFMEAGDPPVYIGFGSIVVDDPDGLTEMIFKAVKIAGVRALVSKGWGGFGRGNDDTPDSIYMLGNTPHDWLFPQVKAVVHHGGAGTTAIGLKCGKPTMIVPFFGDQPFWGEMVAEARAGAVECIPYKKLTAERLAEGIKQCLSEEAQKNVQKIAHSISMEGDGAENAVKSFHGHLPLVGRHNMRCSILQDSVAVWRVKKSSLRLSSLAAELLHRQGKFKWNELKLIRHYEWNDFDGPGEPITGGIGAISDSLYGIGEGLGMVPVRIARHIRKHEEHLRKKREKQRRREDRKMKKAEQEKAQPTANGEPPGSVRQDTTRTLESTASLEPLEPLPSEVAEDIGWGIKRAGAAVLTMPNDLHVAIAQGLHNAPRLYGDATVRKPVKIRGVKSGFTAARKEFAYSVYDGWTGLVKQPKHDFQDGETLAAKFAGLGTGIGKGLGGLVLKNTTAVYAPPAFLVKGLIKHVEKRADGPGSKPFIRRSRIMQGERELHELQAGSSEDNQEHLAKIRAMIEHGWAAYEELWNTAQQQFVPVGGNLIGKYKMRKEKKDWDVNGALENVDTAQYTLQTRKEGYKLEDVVPQESEAHEHTRRESANTNARGMQRAASNTESHGSVDSTARPKLDINLQLPGLSEIHSERGFANTPPPDDVALRFKRVATVA